MTDLAAEIARLDERLSALEEQLDERFNAIMEHSKERTRRLHDIETRLNKMDLADAARVGMAKGAWKVAGLGYGVLIVFASIIVYVGHIALKIFDKIAGP